MSDKNKINAKEEAEVRKVSDEELDRIVGGKSLSDAPRVPEHPVDDSLKNKA